MEVRELEIIATETDRLKILRDGDHHYRLELCTWHPYWARTITAARITGLTISNYRELCDSIKGLDREHAELTAAAATKSKEE